MADLREITVDETTTVTKDNLSNDVFLLNNEILKSSTQQVQFREQTDKPNQLSTSSFTEKEASFSTEISNDSESGRRCLWNREDKLYTANESNKEHFSSCIKSTVNTMTEHQSDIPNTKEASEDINDSRQLENTEYNSSRNNRKWPLFYFDENDKITSIKWIDGSRFELDDAKADGDDDLSEKQSGINDKETGDKVISTVNDIKNELNLASDHMEGDLEQQLTSSNKKNSCFLFPEAIEARDDCFSFLEMQTQEANKNNERETITNNYKDEFKNESSSNLVVSSENNIKSRSVSNDKETDEDISVCRQPENIKYSNIRNNRKWPLFYIDENDKITSIKWIDGSRFESDDAKAEADGVSGTKQSGIYDKETVNKVISVINCNLNKLNLASSGIKGDLEQQTTSSNKKNACFPFFETAEAQDGCFSSLAIPTQEVHKNYENEVETTTHSYKAEIKNENSSNFVGFSENDDKRDSYSFQNQIFVKDKINVEENKFAPDSFIENDFINDRLQQENSKQKNNGIYNIDNKHSKMTSIEDEKLKSIMDIKGEILSPLTFTNRFENAPSNLKDEDAGDIEGTNWKESQRSYGNISLNLANEKQLVEGECEKDFFYETKNSTSIDLITWDIPYEKSESRVIQKISQENSEKFEQKKENFQEKVHSSVNFSENILPEFENEQLEYTNNMISSKSLFNHAFVSSNSINNEVIANKGEIYRTNFCGKTGSSGAIDLFSSGILNEKTESQVYNNENEKTSDKEDENKGRILEKYHDENIVKKDEINSRFDKEHTSEEQNNTHKQKALKQDRKQTDLYCSENNLSVTSTEQMLDDKSASDSCEGEKRMLSYDLKENNVSKNDLNVARKGFIDKITPKLPELVKTKDDLFDKIPSKELNASQMHEDELSVPQVHEDELNALEKGFINELKPKTSKLKKLSCNLLGKIPPKLFLTAVGYDSEKTKCDRLENECNNDHKYNNMIFGHCLECVPIESKKAVKETRATRILPDGSFAYDCDTGRRNRKKSRSVIQCNAFENSGEAKSKEKRVTFAKDIGIFSYHPEKSVFEDFHNYTDTKQKEHDNEKEIRGASEKVSKAMKGDIADEDLKDIPAKLSETLSKPEEKSIKIGDTSAKLKVEHPEIKKIVSKSKESSVEVKESTCYETSNENMKDTSSKAPGTVPKIEKKSTKTGDSSSEIKAGYSKIKETASDSTESLTEVVEPSYYDNIGFIDDWLPSYPSENDLIDDPSGTFEDDEVSAPSEKSCLIDPKINTLPVKFSDPGRHTECKAKKWFKSAGSMGFKRLSLKKKKPIPEK